MEAKFSGFTMYGSVVQDLKAALGELKCSCRLDVPSRQSGR